MIKKAFIQRGIQIVLSRQSLLILSLFYICYAVYQRKLEYCQVRMQSALYKLVFRLVQKNCISSYVNYFHNDCSYSVDNLEDR